IVFYTIVLYLKVAKQNWFWLIVAFMTFFLDNINIKRTLILLVLCFIVICLILGIKSYVQKSRIIENIKEHKRIICIHVLLLAFLIPLIINNVNYILIAFLFLSLVIMISNTNPEKRTALLKYVNHVIWFITTILAAISIVEYIIKKIEVSLVVENNIIITFLVLFTIFFFIYYLYLGVDLVFILSRRKSSLSLWKNVALVIGIAGFLLILPDLMFGKILELYYDINNKNKSYDAIFMYMVENHFNFTMNLGKDDLLNNGFGKFFLYLHFIGGKIMELVIIASLVNLMPIRKVHDNNSK